ncbi:MULTISPECIES: hypothetical protein [unclassified Anabaena]|nr:MULTISPECIES: hypothetical protein [unclassified Anabaena]MTJ52556.1 hypothetical protein [Anabaena sp. UHCC 0253]
MNRSAYAETYELTVGDKVRLSNETKLITQTFGLKSLIGKGLINN